MYDFTNLDFTRFCKYSLILLISNFVTLFEYHIKILSHVYLKRIMIHQHEKR